MYLDFVRRTQRYVPRRHPRSRKISDFDQNYHFTIFQKFEFSGASQFPLSKNPQASMAEVLAKAKKYINGEEALLSKRENSYMQKEKSRAPEEEETEIDPHEGTERTKKGLQRDEATSGTAWAHLSPSHNSNTLLGNSPP